MGMKSGPGGNGMTGGNFRFREDNGTETDDGDPADDGGGTWIAAINANITRSLSNPNFRLRFAMYYEDGTTGNNSKFFNLQQSHEGSAYRVLEPEGDGFEVWCMGVASSHIANHDDTTSYQANSNTDLTEASTTWTDTTNNCVVEEALTMATGSCDFVNTPPLRSISIEYSLALIPDDLAVGETIDFRPYLVAIAPLTGGYDHTARITVGDYVSHPYIPEAVRKPSNLRVLGR